MDNGSINTIIVGKELAELIRLRTLWENCQIGVIITVVDETRSPDFFKSE